MPKRGSTDTMKTSSANSKTGTSTKFAFKGAMLKTERSHEENQERAYIAASRRQDRSIEARVQSARMASEIHKKRTGKSFRITEDIVRKEEMYEEEEDDLPRSYRLLNPNMETTSPEFNAKIEAWMTNRMAMSQYMQKANAEWQGNHINRMFAEQFPQANQQAQRISRQMSLPGSSGFNGPQSPQDFQQDQMRPSPPSPFSPECYSNGQQNFQENASNHLSPTSPDGTHNFGSLSSMPVTHDGSTSDTTLSTQSIQQNQRHLPHFAPEQSVFTAELPNEMKLMMGMGIDMGFDQDMFNQNWATTDDAESFFPLNINDGSQGQIGKLDDLDSKTKIFGDGSWTPQFNEEPAWDSFLNNDSWTGE